ncbi:MAG: dtpA 1 [Gammaproteobacteria bacterium]|jgi:POT family proton-dependent oligopeptide transporter|nr:dtpA 1 [Gammaproteobacteria bacterium]
MIPSAALHKQPKTLYFLFMTEFWERFAYWGIQSILVLFMKQNFHFSDDQTYALYGAIGALLFLTPVVGGFIADRLLGHRHAIMLGAILLSIGYLMAASGSETLFYFAMAAIGCGNGFLKPNISTLLGTVYQENDPRRTSGFTIFYLGINLGSLIGIIGSGQITKYFGWHSGFIAAGIIILFALVVFIMGSKQLSKDQETTAYSVKQYSFNTKIGSLYLGIIATIVAIGYLLHHPANINYLLILITAGIAYVIGSYAFNTTLAERRNLLACIILIIFSIIFWALYFQAPMSLTLFLERNVDRHVFGYQIPASEFWAINAFALVILSPIIIKFWHHQQRKGKEPSAAKKFMLGILLMAASYLILAYSAHGVTDTHMASAWWIVLSYFVQTAGEIYLSPVGLAMITRLAPAPLQGMMMGTWFFASAAANALAGYLAKLASIPDKLVDSIQIASIYGHAFYNYAIIGLVVAIILLFMVPWLNRLTLHKA